eukprot:scaffold3875_cov123-Cylindrotheca_fusiformis.AAC.7
MNEKRFLRTTIAIVIFVLSRLLVFSPTAQSLAAAIRTNARGGGGARATRTISFMSARTQSSSSDVLWKEWVQHSNASYHNFSEQEARDIRSALLEWYRHHRRKLPWRGDALSECRGSTAGVNQVPKDQPASITKFFQVQSSSNNKRKTKKKATVKQEETMEDSFAIKVSGYGVWVSEIMLQQTRVEAVIPYWIKCKCLGFSPVTLFVFHSPSPLQDLAAATEEQVNSHWAGLGFYRRARLLHQGAKHVVENLNGTLPQDVDSLMELPGIGRYTASAVASIAYGQPVAVVDGNVCRVLSRLTGIANHIKSPTLKDKWGWDLANQLILPDDQHAGEINQALMELGATYCAPSGTGIDPRDPLKDYYLSTKLGKAYVDSSTARTNTTAAMGSGCAICDVSGVQTVLEAFASGIEATGSGTPSMTLEDAAKLGHATFPLNPPKTKKREEDLAVAAIANTYKKETWWLLVKRPPKGLLAGQWEFPNVCLQTRTPRSKKPTPKQISAEMTRYLNGLGEDWIATLDRSFIATAPLEHIFSHIKHIMWIASCTSHVELDRLEWSNSNDQEVRWMREKDMKEVGITSGVQKILKAVNGQHNAKIKKRKR